VSSKPTILHKFYLAFERVCCRSQKTTQIRRCCIQSAQRGLNHGRRTGSDHHGQFVEWTGQPPVGWFLDGQFVVTSPKVLDERVPSDHDASVAVLLEAASMGITLTVPMAGGRTGGLRSYLGTETPRRQ
jgi:hypothetical protein